MENSVEGTRAATPEIGTSGGALEAECVLVPRRVGPGRVERGYQRRIEALEQAREREAARREGLAHELERARGELEVSARLERGLQRLADRLEERVETAAQREKRLILALGALQKENELLRERLALRAAPAAALPSARPARAARAGARTRSGAARPRGLWSRLFGRGPAA